MLRHVVPCYPFGKMSYLSSPSLSILSTSLHFLHISPHWLKVENCGETWINVEKHKAMKSTINKTDSQHSVAVADAAAAEAAAAAIGL